MVDAPSQSNFMADTEGFLDVNGEGFYAIPHTHLLAPFLMSIVSDADHWMFISSGGALTAGRRDPALALFPYETDDRLHLASGVTGPITLLRPAGRPTVWQPFSALPSPGVRRNLYKSVVGNQVIFEEIDPQLALAFRYRWSNSDRFGFVRTATLVNLGDRAASVAVMDGLLNLLPSGLEPSLYQSMSNLTNAYKRSEVADAETRLAVYSLESQVRDRPEPAEALIASTVWSAGLGDAVVGVDSGAIDAFRLDHDHPSGPLVTGRAGAYLLRSSVELDPGVETSWTIVADVNRDQLQVVELLGFLRGATTPRAEVDASVRAGSESLVAMMARADALQQAGDRMATAHHFANAMYNVMRGGVFVSDAVIDGADVAAFVALRNTAVALAHRPWLAGLPRKAERRVLLDEARGLGDPQLIRLLYEYLPLTFSRRHGDPSRPWNAFSIRVRDTKGEPVIHYQGNWRDIFQNWEALCMSFPEYLPSVVSVFLNASTADGFNPYRITRDGIDWEIPEPDNAWSNIGYWGDHQIVYLLRLLEATSRFLPGTLTDHLDRAWFSYADVPYRLASYDAMVHDPKATIRFDVESAEAAARRVAECGGDGKLMPSPGGDVYLVTMVEKLLVPALAKLSNFVPGGGIWMNTQRPEWNDANNALVGSGLSMVTLYHLRRYLQYVAGLLRQSGVGAVDMSIEVAEWLAAILGQLQGSLGDLGGSLTDTRRRQIVDGLGGAFAKYRSQVYAAGFSGTATTEISDVIELCEAAVLHLDDTIRRNQRQDGLYHSYNLVHFDPEEAGVEHLYEMLEGQVAVLSSGFLSADERLEVLESLFESSMYRPDQNSFMLYPAPRLASFLEKNVVPAADVAANPLFDSLLAVGNTTIINRDQEGHHRFNAELSNAGELAEALDALAGDEEHRRLVAAHRQEALDTYERVFRHHAYTGRSGSMYAYEGIGSVYWHMVAKLLVAAEESIVDACEQGATAEVVGRLTDMYWRIRSGLGFEKSAADFGAFPIDAYSHTPAHAGAQQPGMTGQVKEELLTRPLEMGLRIEDGEIRFDPILLRDEELLDGAETWNLYPVGGGRQAIELPVGSFGLTICQVPVVVTTTEGPALIEVHMVNGARQSLEGLRLGREISKAIFDRTGEVARIEAFILRPT